MLQTCHSSFHVYNPAIYIHAVPLEIYLAFLRNLALFLTLVLWLVLLLKPLDAYTRMVQPHPLPQGRSRGLSLSTLNVPRRLHLPIILLRSFCLAPSIYGALHNIGLAWNVPARDGGGPLALHSSAMDYWVSILWAMLAGYWSWILTTGLMRRWLYHYELSSAIVRLITLTFINWTISFAVTSHYGDDNPIWSWIFICFILLGANILKIIFASNPKYHKVEDVPHAYRFSWSKDAIVTLLAPFTVVSFITMVCLIGQTSSLRHTSNLVLYSRDTHLDKNLRITDMKPDSELKILVIVLSSWTPKAFDNRQIFRETTLRLKPPNNNKISVAYRFVVGEAPSARAQMAMTPKILAESEKYGDVLILPCSDLYNDLSRKVFKSLEWSNQFVFDFLLKTDDDMFIRFDTVVRELATIGPQRYYWRGLGYWNIPPIRNYENKNAAFDYTLPMFPPFTAGALYILSRDIIHLIASDDGPRLYTKNEDQNLGIWLFPYNIKPIHDRRIQQANVCEDDMIAKHFGDGYDLGGTMYDMYENVVKGRRLCEGFKQHFCAYCYSCRNRVNHWRDWNYACDDVKGVTLREQPEKGCDMHDETSVKDPAAESSIIGKNDEWIVPGLLSQMTSSLSETNDWHLLYWVCWTTAPETFDERHYKTIEMIWVHEPRAVVFMLTTTLPDDFFAPYTKSGYQIYVIQFSRELLLRRHWYLGSNSQTWLRNWDRWEGGHSFFSHLTDYMRYLLLYLYGGTYMDMDALWIRAPPDRNLEFIGADFSSVASDTEWTLDESGMYLAPGVMRFRKGWRAFREIMEDAFSPKYNPECFNCVGPRAITIYVKHHRKPLEDAGLTILPNYILYPLDYMKIHTLLQPDPLAEPELRKILDRSWSIHMFGHSTNHLPVLAGSVIDIAFQKFTLDIPHPIADPTTQKKSVPPQYPFRLVGPRTYVHHPGRLTLSQHRKLLDPAPGTFQGLEVLYVRGGPARVDKAIITFSVSKGSLKVSPEGSGLSSTRIEIHNATKKDVNTFLSSLIYSAPSDTIPIGGHDNFNVKVEFGAAYVGEAVVQVIIAEMEDEVQK